MAYDTLHSTTLIFPRIQTFCS